MKDKIRLHELDWLRVIAIVILLYYHTGMIFVGWDWHIKDATLPASPILEHLMAWLHEWRMPLLLFISGAGTFFALGFRSPTRFAAERFKRLLIPLIFGMFVIVPPQIYFERMEQFGSFGEFYPTVFELVPYPAGGSFSWHHLWFIAYLFLYSLLALPLFLYLRSDRSAAARERLGSLLSRKGALAWFLLPSSLVNMALRPFFPHDTGALINDWAAFTHYLVFFLGGYLVCSDRRIWTAIRRDTPLYLGLALAGLIPFFYGYHFGLPWKLSGVPILEGLCSLAVAWFWILGLIGLGQRHLAFGHPHLKAANEAIYPFYILHQTAIVVLGFYLIQLPLGLWSKFFLVSTVAGAASILCYVLFIRPFNPMRLLFGMKKRMPSTRFENSSQVIVERKILGQNRAG